ncbi:hypothetical protein ACFOMD_15830 [Sphingoaurantiacus capsulatus]|uniref:17 kDa surface antigen n=1 Tax=Sphingoaurantiacus capsulatus TaxID=1771310 RepID=A0ABV7XE03_9SPHN
MRRLFRTAAVAVLTLGMLAGDIATLSFTPTAAEAGWRRGGGGFGYGVGYGHRGRYGGYGYYHRNRVSAGEVIATVAVVGAAVAIANSARRDRDNDDDGWGDRDWDRRRDGGTRQDRREDIAVDECRDEAERQARTYGTSASIRDIYDVDGRGNEVRVRGLVEIAKSEQVGGNMQRQISSERFICIVRNGLVDSYQLGGYASR